MLLPTAERKRPKEKEVIVLLFSSVFLFFCSFPLLKSPFSVLLCFQLLWFSNRHPLLFFPTVKISFGSLCFFSQTSPYFLSVFCFCFPFFSLFFPSIYPLCSSLSPGIYKEEKKERELLPLSSHGTGVRWLGDHWAAASGLPAGLVPSIFSSNGR